MADNTDLLGAISAAVDSAGDTAAPAAPEPEEKDDAVPAAETDESGAAPAGEGEESEGGDDGAEEGEGDASAEGAEGDGKDKKPAAGAAEPKLGPDGKPIAAEAPPKDEKPDPVKQRNDFINGPIDQRLKKGTQDRIQFLANEVKRQDASLANANTLFDAIDDTGMQPDELASMLSYSRIRHKGTAEEKKGAYAFLKSELRALALELGETDTVDFLAEHADLQAAVEANQITAEYAKEVALARSRGAHSTAIQTHTAEQQEAQRVHASGVQALTMLGNQLQARDGAVYAAKRATVVAMLGPKKDAFGRVIDQGVLAALHPSQWAAMFQRTYDALPAPAPPAAPAAPATPAAPKPQPLRPGTPAGGHGKKEPKSLLDAVSFAVDGNED